MKTAKEAATNSNATQSRITAKWKAKAGIRKDIILLWVEEMVQDQEEVSGEREAKKSFRRELEGCDAQTTELAQKLVTQALGDLGYSAMWTADLLAVRW